MSLSTDAEPARCSRCKREIRAAKAVAKGIGRGCAAREREEALARAVASFTRAQVRAGLALIAAGGITATSRPGVFAVASSDGVTVYVTTWDTCSCLSRLRCKHMAGVRLYQARKSFGRKAA